MVERSWGVAGRGNIGSQLMADIGNDPGLGLSPTPQLIITSAGVMDPCGTKPYGVADLRDVPPSLMPDVLFLACPTTDSGQPARDYAEHALRSGRVVVTAEKGMLASDFAGLESLSAGFRRLGFSATVGGGTLILPKARQVVAANRGNISRIVLVPNGTLQATLSDASAAYGRGVSPEAAVARSVELGFAEPDSHLPLSVIRAEVNGDVPKKLLIFLRYVLGVQDVSLTELTNDRLNSADIEQAFAEDRRFVVSVTNTELTDTPTGSQLIGGVTLERQGWLIESGFQEIGSAALRQLHTMTGPGNGFTIFVNRDGKDDIHTVTGAGAGAKPTAGAMLEDYRRLTRAAYEDSAFVAKENSYQGGRPREVLSAAQSQEARHRLHSNNTAILQRAGLRLAYSIVWWPHQPDFVIESFWRARAKLTGRYGDTCVLNGPGIIPTDASTDSCSLGLWVPDGDGSTFARNDPNLNLNNGHWTLNRADEVPNEHRPKLSIF